MGPADFDNVVVDAEERRFLMDKVEKGKRLTDDEAFKVLAILMQIIRQDNQARSDAELFLAAFSARYGIEIRG